MIQTLCSRRIFALALLVALIFDPTASVAGRQSRRIEAARRTKLPSPERIIADYHRALGGKRNVARVKDAVYEWDVKTSEEASRATARTQLKQPGAVRFDLLSGTDQRSDAATPRSAWARETGNDLRTLTDREAAAAKLEAALAASRFINFRKQNILARTDSIDATFGEPAHVVEFSTRDGARLNYYFGVANKLLLGLKDDARGRLIRFDDYRTSGSQGGLLEPHRVESSPLAAAEGVARSSVLVLREARYNTNLGDAVFDPPTSEPLDVAALLREVKINQEGIDARVRQYTYLQRFTEREINDRGEITKEKVTVSEVYPLGNRRPAFKLISENGVALSPERAAREAERVAKEIENAEKTETKTKLKIERRRDERQAKLEKQRRKAGSEPNEKEVKVIEDEDAISFTGTLLKASDLISPRRERLRDRDAVVFDFRPRAGFKPGNRAESLISKLSGIFWIDPVDKQVMRFEAKLDKGYKIGGGLVASVRPGSKLIAEQIRLPDGLWMPREAQFDVGVKLFLVAGFSQNAVLEWSDYKRFDAKTNDATIETPQEKP